MLKAMMRGNEIVIGTRRYNEASSTYAVNPALAYEMFIKHRVDASELLFYFHTIYLLGERPALITILIVIFNPYYHGDLVSSRNEIVA